MATAGSATLSSSPAVIFSGPPAAAFTVVNRDSANDIQVQVAGIHTDGSFAIVAPGTSMTFGIGGNNYGSITKVTAQAPSGSPVINWTVAGNK